MNSGISIRMARLRRRCGRGVARAAFLSLLITFGMTAALAAQHHQEARPAAPARQSQPAPPPRRESRPPAKPRAGTPVQNLPGGRPAVDYSRPQNFTQQPPADGQRSGGNFPAVPRQNFAGNPGTSRPGIYPGSGRPGQEHLPQWLSQHQNLTPSQQEQALRREPGFNRLAPDQQQRVLDRLRSLDSRPPQVRERMLARNEAFERLTPEGRQEVRAAAQALRMMPDDRRRLVGRAFHDLRAIPPQDRGAILNSARFSHDFSPQERHILGNLLSIEPYQPH